METSLRTDLGEGLYPFLSSSMVKLMGEVEMFLPNGAATGQVVMLLQTTP